MKAMEKSIEETIKSLSRTYNVKVKRDEKLGMAMAYHRRSDTILYSISSIKSAYLSLRRYYPLRLSELIRHFFGHELAHRKLHISGGRQASVIESDVSILLRSPEEAFSMMPPGEDIHTFIFDRACAIANELFKEYYAETNNPLYEPSVARAMALDAREVIRQNLREAREAIHALPVAYCGEINSYFIYPLTVLPIQDLRVLPEFQTLKRIKQYLRVKILSPRDVYDPQKIKEIANIIVYELYRQGRSNPLKETHKGKAPTLREWGFPVCRR